MLISMGEVSGEIDSTKAVNSFQKKAHGNPIQSTP